jgi:hypothetical protein
MTLEEIRENIRGLQDDILYLERQLDGLDPDGLDAESKERVLNVKWRLLSEQRGLLERRENDTLDLY